MDLRIILEQGIQRLKSNVPQEILNILSEKTVLSGGSLVWALTDGYLDTRYQPSVNSQIAPLILSIENLLKDEIIPNPGKINDFDIYTILDERTIYEYFSSFGYRCLEKDIFEGKSCIRNYKSKDYSGYLLRLKKCSDIDEYTNSINYFNQTYSEGSRSLNEFYNEMNSAYFTNTDKIDIIFVNYDEELYGHPAQFIIREFDFDFIKMWFDGSIIDFQNEKPITALMSRKFSLDFNPNMTINHYKSFTTLKRIIKYMRRGFQFEGPVETFKIVISKASSRIFSYIIRRFADIEDNMRAIMKNTLDLIKMANPNNRLFDYQYISRLIIKKDYYVGYYFVRDYLQDGEFVKIFLKKVILSSLVIPGRLLFVRNEMKFLNEEQLSWVALEVVKNDFTKAETIFNEFYGGDTNKIFISFRFHPKKAVSAIINCLSKEACPFNDLLFNILSLLINNGDYVLTDLDLFYIEKSHPINMIQILPKYYAEILKLYFVSTVKDPYNYYRSFKEYLKFKTENIKNNIAFITENFIPIDGFLLVPLMLIFDDIGPFLQKIDQSNFKEKFLLMGNYETLTDQRLDYNKISIKLRRLGLRFTFDEIDRSMNENDIKILTIIFSTMILNDKLKILNNEKYEKILSSKDLIEYLLEDEELLDRYNFSNDESVLMNEIIKYSKINMIPLPIQILRANMERFLNPKDNPSEKLLSVIPLLSSQIEIESMIKSIHIFRTKLFELILNLMQTNDVYDKTYNKQLGIENFAIYNGIPTTINGYSLYTLIFGAIFNGQLLNIYPEIMRYYSFEGLIGMLYNRYSLSVSFNEVNGSLVLSFYNKRMSKLLKEFLMKELGITENETQKNNEDEPKATKRRKRSPD